MWFYFWVFFEMSFCRVFFSLICFLVFRFFLFWLSSSRIICHKITACTMDTVCSKNLKLSIFLLSFVKDRRTRNFMSDFALREAL
jgi:hypothetical protein